ncbi:MAG: DUF1364 domain-containing protein [Ectothiorhodospiraceae bacterium]|nr:DUF1364 domain-containing protein [Ectothiorhodospiraceae bacterium]
MFPKDPPVRSRQLRESARGQDCTIRLPGICSGDPATTILAHPPVGNGGMSSKGSDDDGAFCCDACHSVIDGRVKARIHPEEILECWIRGSQETRAIWRRMGLLSVKGAA